MRCLLLTICLLSCAQVAHGEGWVLDTKLHQYSQISDWSGRLTKDFGNIKLSALARQFTDGAAEDGNHMDIGVAGDWWGVSFAKGRYVTSSLQAFSIQWPDSKKPTVYKTPSDSVFHAYLQQEFGSGFVKGDFYQKDGTAEFELHARTEF